MRKNHRLSKSWIVASAAIVVLSALAPTASLGQARLPSGRFHVRLPASYGATPLSTIIHANAALVAAQGDFLESAANARLTNAEAAQVEMANSVQWVRTYFERKEINRRKTRQKSYIERQQATNLLRKRLIDENSEIELDKDPTEDLNIMLLDLNVKVQAQRFYPEIEGTLVNSESDRKLSAVDIGHIGLTDGGRKNGRLLRFQANETEALKERWPRVLRSPQLDEQRSRYEQARRDAIDELKATGEVNYETSQRLMKRVDALTMAFKLHWSRERRFHDGSDSYWAFLDGEKHLKSIAWGVHRLIDAEDQRAFDGSYRFEGDTVAELVGHMHRFGLKFAPQRPGDEGVYETLYVTMRRLWKQFANDISG